MSNWDKIPKLNKINMEVKPMSNYPDGVSEGDINRQHQEPPDLDQFIDDNIDTLIEGYVKEVPQIWEQFQSEMVRPTGRPYESFNSAPVEVYDIFLEWFSSDELKVKVFREWVEESLPDEPC